jgi:hypothetical protein
MGWEWIVLCSLIFLVAVLCLILDYGINHIPRVRQNWETLKKAFRS